MVSVPGQKRVRISRFEKPVFWASRYLTQPWPPPILFGQENSSYCKLRQSLAIVPGHPLGGVGRQFPGMLLQLDQVVERVGATQLARVNQAHKQVPDLGPVQGPIKQSVLAATETFS